MAKNESFSGPRPARMPPAFSDSFHYCEGCDALSSFAGDECQMCKLRGGPIERPK